MNETSLLHLFIEQAPYALPGIHIDRRNIINERSARGHWLSNGIKGQADAFAIYRGLHVEIETKAARGVLAEEQKRWRKRCEGGLCPHLVLRAHRNESPDDTVARWISELRTVLEQA